MSKLLFAMTKQRGLLNKHKIKQITVFVELVYFENEEPV